jgi:hypothetical protein
MIKNGLIKRFAEVGKIKIGGKGETRKSKEGKDYQLPVRYDSFVITTTEKGADGNYIPDKELMVKLGGKDIKEISIRLPFDSVDMNFFTSFQYYHGSKCICRGDGERAVRIGKDEKESSVECNPSTCEFLKSDKCKVSGILSCQIPQSMEAGGIYRFRTHSWNSVSAILASLEYIRENTKGILQGLPLKLKFLKKSTQDHGNVNIVTIVLDGMKMIEMRNLALEEFESRARLGIDMKMIENQAREAGVMIDNDDPKDVETEFYTPTGTEDTTLIPGVTADQAKDKLAAQPEVKKVNENQGSLL